MPYRQSRSMNASEYICICIIMYAYTLDPENATVQLTDHTHVACSCV